MKKVKRTGISGKVRHRAAAKSGNIVVRAPKLSGKYQARLGITPEQFGHAYRQAQAGSPAKLFGIMKHFHAIDDEIPASMDALISAVLSEDYQITLREESAEAEKQQRFFAELFSEIDIIPLAESLLESRFYGMVAAFPVWDNYIFEGTTYQAPVTYELLPLSWIYAQKETRDADYRTLHVGDSPYHAVVNDVLLMTENKLPSYEDIDFTEFGVGLGCLRFAIMKYFQFEDWPAMNEAFATPLILGQLTEGFQQADKELLETAVASLGNASRAVLPPHSKIELPSASMGGADSYEKLIQLINRVIAVKIKSESQTDNMNKHGSNAAMVTADGVKLRLAASMLAKLRGMLNRRFMKQVADRNWNGNLLVNLNWKVAEYKDMQTELSIDKGLYTMGFKLSRKELAERYGRNEAQEVEDELKRASGTLLGGL